MAGKGKRQVLTLEGYEFGEKGKAFWHQSDVHRKVKLLRHVMLLCRTDHSRLVSLRIMGFQSIYLQ